MKNKGFTLVELIMVISLLGIIMVVALPRLSIFNDFYNSKKIDLIYSGISSAQKLAIFSRNTIYVKITSSTLKVCSDVSCASVLTKMSGSYNIYNLSFSNGDNITSTTSDFSFDSTGTPSFTTVNNIGVGGDPSFDIEPLSGLIHY